MRRIVFIRLPVDFSSSLLDLCSEFTPLVENLSNNEIFLDLTGCGATGRILKSIALQVYQEIATRSEIGLAASKLAARTAVMRSRMHDSEQTFFRIIDNRQAYIAEVLPGREKEFISSLPLTEFYPLNTKEVKLFTRMGYSRVGELAGFSPYRLTKIVKRDAWMLVQNIRGMDSSPVVGLYPPFRIVYPVDLESEVTDGNIIKNHLGRTVKVLLKVLEKRHSGCKDVSLELWGEDFKIKQDRSLGALCNEEKYLGHVIEGLWEKAGTQKPILGFTITLSEIKPVQMEEQDLFTNRMVVGINRRETSIGDTIDDLLYRFPGLISRGVEIDRREQLLAFWDPWRCRSGKTEV